MSEGTEGILTASEEIVAKLWQVFELKSEIHLLNEHVEVVLLILSLYKDGYISKDLLHEESKFKRLLVDTFLKADDRLSQTYAAIYSVLEADYNAIDEKSLSKYLSIIFEIDEVSLRDNYFDVFEQALYRLEKMKGRSAGVHLQPYELNRFIGSFISRDFAGRMFNPFAGAASYRGIQGITSIFADRSTTYYGQEINPKVWAVGTLRMMNSDIYENSKYECADSIQNWPDETEKFDLIITHLPFNLNLQKQFGQGQEVYKTLEAFVINKGLSSLNENGKLAVILPQVFLTALGEAYEVRKHLVTNDLLETVITFPAEILQQTKVPFALVIVNKQKEKARTTRFVIADQFIKIRKSNEPIFKYQELLEDLYDFDITKEETDFVIGVKNLDIKSFDYNLNAPLYFTKEVKGVKLKELLKPITTKRIYEAFEGKYIRISNLKNDPLDFMLKANALAVAEVNLRNIQFIDEPCLLLAKQFKNLKPTYFYNEGETIALNKGILPYRVNEEKVDIGYLINELHKDYVQEQLDAYRTGSVIPFIRRGDLLEIMVELPPLEMQRAKMTGVQEANVALKVKEAILEAEKHGLYNRYFQEVSALKHAMGKPLFKINTQVKRLKQLVMAVASENKESNSQLIYALLESIEGNLENASNILEHADSEIRTENFELEAIDIIKFLNHYFTDLMTIYKNRFEFSYSTAEIGLEDIGKVFLLANTDLLKILLDNIVDNALRHSFTNQEGDYEIEFYFDLVKLKNAPFFQLEILYNGNPFPTNFDQDKFIRKHVKAGKTGHTGQGGYQIDQIVKRFGGYFTLDTNCMQQVPTCFNFYFPVVEINIEDYEIL